MRNTALKMMLGIAVGTWLAGCHAVPSQAAKPGNGPVVFFAPHPDDESFCCVAAILQALADGKRVHVVVFTNGDGWPRATGAYRKKAEDKLTPEDYLEMARVRQHETLAALAELGLKPTDVTFLGYPDAGLDRVYANVDAAPFQLGFTQKTTTYGPVVVDYHSRQHGTPGSYRRQSVLEDVIGLLRELKPQQLYVTHDADTHLDHQAAFWFVRDAAKAVGYRGEVHTYVNHYDNYPCPSKLPCPVPVRVVPSVAQADAKFKTMMHYQSQVWHFFSSESSLKLRAAAPELYWPVDPVSFEPTRGQR
jgi:LmbE family N-acetylglucosaminyl deacetylase